MTLKSYLINLWNAVLGRPACPIEDRPTAHESPAPARAFAMVDLSPAGEYFVAIVLTKPKGDGSTEIMLRTGRWIGASENQVLGAAVNDAMSANPGFQISLRRVMKAKENNA